MSRVTKVGVVVKDKMDKSVVVAVERLVRHPLYRRSFKKTSTFVAHDGENRCKKGDRVRIIESRPLSRRKRWRVVEILHTPTDVEDTTKEEPAQVPAARRSPPSGEKREIE